jgi:hypothetical protein
MRKYGLLGGVISIVCAMAIIFFYLHCRRPAVASPPGPQHNLTSYNLSPYDLSPADAVRLEARATGGDCKAAEILTRYYFDVALDLYTGIKWARIAAKRCPDAEDKMELGFILVHYKSDPKIAAEVADLIVQIRKTSPARAAELKDELDGKSTAGWGLVPQPTD